MPDLAIAQEKVDLKLRVGYASIEEAAKSKLQSVMDAIKDQSG